MSFEGTFKIDRAIEEFETWLGSANFDDVTLESVLDTLREIRDTDAAEVDA